MKLKSKKDVKPWENVSIDEILPNNPKYTKMVILSYIFIAYFLFSVTNLLNIPNVYLSILNICFYALIAYALIYLDTNGKPKGMFISWTLFSVLLIIILNIIIFVISGFHFSELLKWFSSPVNTFEFILGKLSSVFFLVALSSGPTTLMVTQNPRIEKHILIISVIFFIFTIIAIILLILLWIRL